jgi:hypothetical protein
MFKSLFLTLVQSKFNAYLIFAAGFLWDVFTLNRIDNPIDNAILGGYVLMACLSFILSYGVQSGYFTHGFFTRRPQIWELSFQFFLGGLFSAYVVYYFQSATISSTFFFLILMAGLLLANEFLPRRMSNLYFETAMITIAILTYFIYLVPVLTKMMGIWVFLLSTFISLGIVFIVMSVIGAMSLNHEQHQTAKLWYTSAGVYVVILLFYFMNIIPPVPLAAKHVGAYIDYEKVEGGYRLLKADTGWWSRLRFWEEEVPYKPGQPVYFFASVFAPTGMSFKIVHHWQRYDETKQEWISVEKIDYRATGGRDGGYRGYSQKAALQYGLWRVDIENERGYVVARMRMRLVPDQYYRSKWEFR